MIDESDEDEFLPSFLTATAGVVLAICAATLVGAAMDRFFPAEFVAPPFAKAIGEASAAVSRAALREKVADNFLSIVLHLSPPLGLTVWLASRWRLRSVAFYVICPALAYFVAQGLLHYGFIGMGGFEVGRITGVPQYPSWKYIVPHGAKQLAIGAAGGLAYWLYARNFPPLSAWLQDDDYQ